MAGHLVRLIGDKLDYLSFESQNLKDPSAAFNFYAGNVEDKFIVEPGAILISWAGQLVSFGVHVWSGPRGVLNQHIFKVEPRIKFEREYLREALDQVVEGAKATFQGKRNEASHKGFARRGNNRAATD